ncbi:MAG TPA: hypothetical protein VFA65_00190 [Bryobacteraceae bacterium]|nr:hypothetical protein [Bryobacteraceae bacterium]
MPTSTSGGAIGDSATIASAVSAQGEKPFPLAQRGQKPQSTSVVSEDPTVFPADVQQDALAQNLVDGSRSGVPCVEECMRRPGSV